MSRLKRIQNNPLENSEFSEYEVLYTYDVTQKMKRWNDGKLHFFQFNKKLQVYDDSGRLIHSDFYKLGQKTGMDYRIFKSEEVLRLNGNSECNGGLLVEIVQLQNIYRRDISQMTKASGAHNSTEVSITNRLVNLNDSKAKNSTIDTDKITPVIPQRRIRVGLSRRQLTPSKTNSKTTTTKKLSTPAEEIIDTKTINTQIIPKDTNTGIRPLQRREARNQIVATKIAREQSSPTQKVPNMKRNVNTDSTNEPLTPSKKRQSVCQDYKISELGSSYDEFITGTAKRSKKNDQLLNDLIMQTDEQESHNYLNMEEVPASKVDVYASPNEDEISEISDDEAINSFDKGGNSNSVGQMKVTDISRYI